MNSYEDTDIALIQSNVSADIIPSIKAEIDDLKQSVQNRRDLTPQPDGNDLQLTSPLPPGPRYDKLPDDFKNALLAVKLNAKYSYIEIFSAGTIKQLEQSLPELSRGKTKILQLIIRAQTQLKCQHLTAEAAKCSAYKPVCKRVRQEIVQKNEPIKREVPAGALDAMLCVPEHAFAISSFQTREAVLGTVELHACIGLAVINLTKKRAGITHLDQPTVETYQNSLRAMVDAILSDKGDEARVYLVGGAGEPKEKFQEGNPAYQACLDSETLGCSIMDFLRNYPGLKISTDMFYEPRPGAFGVKVGPSKPPEVFRIPDEAADRFEDDEDDRIHHQNMMTDAIYYQELQEYFPGADFLSGRLSATTVAVV